MGDMPLSIPIMTFFIDTVLVILVEKISTVAAGTGVMLLIEVLTPPPAPPPLRTAAA